MKFRTCRYSISTVTVHLRLISLLLLFCIGLPAAAQQPSQKATPQKSQKQQKKEEAAKVDTIPLYNGTIPLSVTASNCSECQRKVTPENSSKLYSLIPSQTISSPFRQSNHLTAALDFATSLFSDVFLQPVKGITNTRQNANTIIFFRVNFHQLLMGQLFYVISHMDKRSL